MTGRPKWLRKEVALTPKGLLSPCGKQGRDGGQNTGLVAQPSMRLCLDGNERSSRDGTGISIHGYEIMTWADLDREMDWFDHQYAQAYYAGREDPKEVVIEQWQTDERYRRILKLPPNPAWL